jgi:hypothetical protein
MLIAAKNGSEGHSFENPMTNHKMLPSVAIEKAAYATW